MQVLSIGDRIVEGRYRIHSRFRRAVNFLGDQSLVSLVTLDAGAGPINIVVSGIDPRRIRGLRVERAAVATGGERFVIDRSIVYDSAIALSPGDLAGLHKNLPAFGRFLVEFAPEKSLAFLLDESRRVHLRPGFEQNLQVLRNRREGNVEMGCQLLDRPGLVHQQVEQAAAVWIRNGMENGSCALVYRHPFKLSLK